MNSVPINKNDILNLLRSNQTKIKTFGAKNLALFGSYLKNEQTLTSDVDLLVEFFKEEKNYNNFINLVFYLEEILNKEVDLITPESLSPYLKPSIINNMEYIFND